MRELLDSVKRLDVEIKGVVQTDEERLWMIATILILSERAGLVRFTGSVSSRAPGKSVPLPRGLVNLLISCENQGLVKINRKKLRLSTHLGR